MPSILTHYGFNKDVIDSEIKFLKGNEDIYLVGAQGPDPFFFYGIIPFLGAKNAGSVRNFGSKLHKMNPSKVFNFFFDYANKSKEKDIIYSYILGAGLHYILDRKIHPYVYFKTGFSENKKMKRKYFVDHTLFETNIDVLLMNDRYKAFKVKPVEAIKCDDDKIEKVSEMYEKLAKKILNEEMISDDTFEDCYMHMCKIENILYSKKGIKKGIVNFMLKNTPLNTMMHPLEVKDDDNVDYLNLKKKIWQDPQSETPYDKSLYELIDGAKLEAREWFNLVVDSYEGRKINVEDFTKGLIYDGYEEGSKMKVFKSVYKNKENLGNEA